MTYQIIDWAYNRLWKDRVFNSVLDAWDFVMENYKEEEYQDIYIIPID